MKMRGIFRLTCSFFGFVLLSVNALPQPAAAVERIDTMGLIVLYPHYGSVELVCGSRPSRSDRSVLVMAEAAYTRVKPLRRKFSHANIHGVHVSRGRRHEGTPFERKTGAFVWYDGQYRFLQLSTYDTATQQVTRLPDYGRRCRVFDTAAAHKGMGFMQEIIVHQGRIMPTVRKDGEMHQYRALCSHKGRLCIIESDTVVAFAGFKRMLHAFGVSEALYLDMGSGWNYAWYRDEENIVELNPEAYYSRFCTNWIVFRRRK
ncbi:MAG: Uncharacterized protein AUK63_1304 [bacterium P3]|nr:MAG: Uncharacterized protein AUK63_1304 [bacterium P3]KWW40412.1 MAG: Uncharacterized protein F083_1649 [bacterium F083]